VLVPVALIRMESQSSRISVALRSRTWRLDVYDCVINTLYIPQVRKDGNWILDRGDRGDCRSTVTFVLLQLTMVHNTMPHAECSRYS